MTKTIKLMSDYQCYPLWAMGNEAPANLAPNTLPLSSETLLGLEKWAAMFDSWMDLEEPASTTEPSATQVATFEAEGIRLWKQLRRELAPTYEVYYKSIMQNRLLSNPSDLEVWSPKKPLNKPQAISEGVKSTQPA